MATEKGVPMSDKDNDQGSMRVDTDLVKKLAKMLDENDLSEIEVEDNGRRIVVKRKLAGVAALPASTAPAPSPPPPAAAAAPPAATEASPDSHPGAVKSPMVGTVYLSGEPGAPPFVAAGAKVSEGDTLLIIEAMKVMNPITAPRSGTVRQILVQDGQPVEYEQPLAIIE
jgi:acetyl-CoA carboxylase biotin carboxyl carrier protein